MASRKTEAAIDNTPASAASADVPSTEGTAITTVEVAPAVASAIAAIASIEAAIATIGTASPAASAALAEQLDTARGALALAEADAKLEADKASEIATARAAAASHKLPDDMLAIMLQAIEAKYAPAPPAAPESPADAPAPYVGRKPIGSRTAERNAAALAQFDSDPTIASRAAASFTAFRSDWAGDLRGVSAQAGTRYVSIVAFAGAGVAGKSDYLALVPQLRRYALTLGLKDGGESAASDAWLFAFGPHAPSAPKGSDTLRLKFLTGAGVALHADGRFRLTHRGTAGARFVDSDAAALAAWTGGATTPAATAPQAPADAPAAPSAPRVPTAPNVQALPNGALASASRCQHCTARNFLTNTECSACGAADWQAA